MQTEGTKLIFIMNFSVLDFSRMPQIAQVNLYLQNFPGGGEGGMPCPPPPPPEIYSLFFLLAIPGSEKSKFSLVISYGIDTVHVHKIICTEFTQAVTNLWFLRTTYENKRCHFYSVVMPYCHRRAP